MLTNRATCAGPRGYRSHGRRARYPV